MSPTLPPRPLRVQSDARLVELARRGEAPAFEALVRRYRKQLLGYCRRLRAGDAQAEDALQQGLLQAWRSLRRGDEVSDVKSWLYRVVHNAALDALRRPGREHVELDESLHAHTAPSAESELDRRIAVHDALSGLAALPDMQREALVRTAVHGDSHEQVAYALGLSHAAVRGLVHRARVAMRTAVTALLPSRALQWVLRCALGASAGPELAAGGAGSDGMLGALAKGAALLATGGVIASGLAVTHARVHSHPSPSVSPAGSPHAGAERRLGAFRHRAPRTRSIAPAHIVPSKPVAQPAPGTAQARQPTSASELAQPGVRSGRPHALALRPRPHGEGREFDSDRREFDGAPADRPQRLDIASESQRGERAADHHGDSAQSAQATGTGGSGSAAPGDGGAGNFDGGRSAARAIESSDGRDGPREARSQPLSDASDSEGAAQASSAQASFEQGSSEQEDSAQGGAAQGDSARTPGPGGGTSGARGAAADGQAHSEDS
jgi:RNA polymerase sigma factor (sigma-70 family)